MFKSWGVFSNPFWFLIERNVDISTQHLMRAIRLFIPEGEGGGSEASAVQERQEGPLAGGEEKRTSVTYQPSEQASPLLREDEFAKQLRLARYLAASSLPPSRPPGAAPIRQERVKKRDP
jgi:hypothetical protein